MVWNNGPWGDGGEYNESGIAPDGTIDPLRKKVAVMMHMMPNPTREMADQIYRGMKRRGMGSYRDGGVVSTSAVRGGGKAIRGVGKGKVV